MKGSTNKKQKQWKK